MRIWLNPISGIMDESDSPVESPGQCYILYVLPFYAVPEPSRKRLNAQVRISLYRTSNVQQSGQPRPPMGNQTSATISIPPRSLHSHTRFKEPQDEIRIGLSHEAR